MFIPRLKPRVRSIYLLVRSREVLDALAPMLAAPGRRPVHAADWRELRELYLDAPTTSLFIAEPFASGVDGDVVHEELRRFLADFPACALIAPAAVDERSLRTVRALAACGVTDLLEVPDGLEEWRLEARLQMNVERRVHRALEGLALLEAPATRVFLAAAAVVIAQTGDPARVARALKVSEGELADFCERRALPEPGRLLEWIRLVYASELLDEPGRPPSSAARTLGYSGEGEMEEAAMRLVGLPVGELRALGAYRLAASGLRNELLAVRREAENRRGER
jgi:AraC-like DNA-binding protein